MFPVFQYIIETLVEVCTWLVLPLQFLVLPNFHSCFYNCLETRKMFSSKFTRKFIKKQEASANPNPNPKMFSGVQLGQI